MKSNGGNKVRDRLEQFLATAVKQTPDATALGDVTGREITYRELQARVEAATQDLHLLGVQPGDRIGLCLPKTIDTLVLVLAILTARGAYVPVDVSAPPARSAMIFSDCVVRMVLCSPDKQVALSEALSEADFPVEPAKVEIANARVLTALNMPSAGDPDLAYILYTSGSTGRPKGVAHTHASALAFVNWCSETFAPTSEDRFSSHAPFHFDLSILDIYLPLKHAAYLRLISADESKSPGQLAKIIQDHELSFWYSTPSVLRTLVEFGQLETRDHSALRVICFAGEVFPPRHLRALAAHWPGPRFFNLYGPTETNVCTGFEVTAPSELPDNSSIPIGFASCGDELLLVDPEDRPVASGEAGELVVHGPSVMREYWNAPEKNKAAFLVHDGKRWYRTGDIVEPSADGALTYRGRRDRMIKRRGYRIELGEIEAALSRHSHISQAAAVPIETADGEVNVVAFYAWDAETRPSIIELKRHSSRTLPAYMIPDRFQQLDQLPHTSTDKLDYQKMKELAVGLLSHS